MKKISGGVVRVGIVGLGRSGWDIHARFLESLKDKYQIVAVFDGDLTRQKEAADRFGCRTYSDFKAFLKDIEVELVIIAMPNHLHAGWSIESLEAGKNVVCEKPMATILRDADEMIETAKKTGCLLTVFQNRRYGPDFLKVREVLQSGRLGRIVMIRMAWHSFSRRWDWQTLKEYGGGMLNNNGSHAVDQALELLGEKEVKVFCHMERVLASGDAEDHVKIILQAPGSPIIDLEITSGCAYPQEVWLVMGTRGGLTGNYKTLRWKYFDPQRLPAKQADWKSTPDRSYNSEQIPWQEETWTCPNDAIPEGVCFYLDLHKTLCHNAPLVITPESVHRQIAVIDKCHEMSSI